MGWSNPLILLRIIANKDLQWILPTAVVLWPIAFLIAFLSWFSVKLTGEVAASIGAAPQKLRNWFSRKGSSVSIGQRLAVSSVSVWKTLSLLSFKVGLKGLVAAAQNLVVFYAMLFYIPALLLFGLAAWLLGIPVALAWFSGLAWFTLKAVAPGTFALSRVWIVLVPLSGVTNAVLFLGAMQHTVYKCRHGSSWPFRKAMLALCSMLLLASLLFFGPLWFISDGWALSTPTPAQMAAQNTPSSIARYLAYLNAVDMVAAFGLLAAALLLLAHTLIWPHVRRPIIALRLVGIGFNSTVLYGFGVGFLLLATGRLGDLVREVVARPQTYEAIEKFFKDLVP
jgi:hypothetical protein